MHAILPQSVAILNRVAAEVHHRTNRRGPLPNRLETDAPARRGAPGSHSRDPHDLQ